MVACRTLARNTYRKACVNSKEKLMYHHVKKLMYTVDVGEPDPKFGKMLLEQFGGANG